MGSRHPNLSFIGSSMVPKRALKELFRHKRREQHIAEFHDRRDVRLRLQVPGGKPTAAGPQRAWQLARYGDNALALPACVDCHGGDITGGGPILPGLAQPAAYTAAQLDAFRTGERKNDGDGIMQSMAKRLSDADIKALSEYYGTMR
jgi:cytochrome c553